MQDANQNGIVSNDLFINGLVDSSLGRPNSFIPEGDENYLFSRTVSITGSEIEYQFEDLHASNADTSQPKTSIQSTEASSVQEGYSGEEKVNEVSDEHRAQEEEFEDGSIQRRESSPFIKTIVAERKIAQYDSFTMNSWAELQETMKSNYFVIKNGKNF